MDQTTEPGQIVILNDAPRAGKSSIAKVIQETFEGVWMNLGVDVQEEVHKPGIYDLEVDTSLLSPEECAATIRERLGTGPPPSAFRQLARG